MEPQSVDINQLALVDPVAAYGIVLGVPRVPISMNCSGSFLSFSLSQIPIEAGLDTAIAQRTWIQSISYSLQQPNVFAGNVFKTLYDAQLKAQPGISVKLQVQSGPRYVVSPNYTPLENFTDQFNTSWAHGWPLFKQQSIQASFILTQAPPNVSPNGPPYNVTLTFNGWQFLDYQVDEISPETARDALNKMGFKVADTTAIPQPLVGAGALPRRR